MADKNKLNWKNNCSYTFIAVQITRKFREFWNLIIKNCVLYLY